MNADKLQTTALRIAVADDEGFMRKYLQTVLPRLGHEVIAVAHTGKQLVEQCRGNWPDLIITDVNMPELDGLQAACQIYQEHPTPIVVISGHHGPEVIERTVAAHVMAYLEKPIKARDLEPAIAIAVRRFQRLQHLLRDHARSRDPNAQQALIARAIQVLVGWSKLSAEDAQVRLQQLADERGLELVEIAQMIVMAEDHLGANHTAEPTDPPRRHESDHGPAERN